ncbi:MAG: glycosyltransferase family 4 protein [Gemmatimonadaceae bacterium]
MLSDLYGDGLQYRENLLAKYFSRQGHEVTVLASTYESAIDYQAERHDRHAPRREYLDGAAKIIKHPYSLNVLNRLRRFGGVAETLEREAPDLIISQDIHLNLHEAVAYKRRHPSCRLILDSSMDYTNSARTWLSLRVLHGMVRKGLLSRWRRHIDRIYAVTPGTARFLHEVYDIPQEEIELLPLGGDIDVAMTVMERGSGAVVRAQLGIPEAAVVLFSGGKFVPLKKTHVLVDAFLALDDPAVHLILIGEAEKGHEAYQQAMVDACRGNPRAHFVGWVSGEKVYEFMAASSIAVFPGSQSALWQQAMSMGLPLIVGAETEWGNQDPSYMNPYGNMTILPLPEIRSDVIAGNIREIIDTPGELSRRRTLSLRVADELLNYHRVVCTMIAAARRPVR